LHYPDTGGAVAEVKKRNDPSLGAIASPLAAQLHGMNILKEQLEDDLENYTRFVLLTRKQSSNFTDFQLKKNHKCSVSFHLEHKAGALAAVLAILARQGVNLMKIESRPIQGRAFEYLFYLDFQISADQRHRGGAIVEALEASVSNLNVFGFYECC
jgi:prephenate dehydratase